MTKQPSQRPFRGHPLAIAAVLVLASYAQAQDFSLNSLTVDTQSGQTLGSISQQGDVKRFFEVQKEVVFKTLRHLGMAPESLPAKVRQALERPQTTNPDAFALFSRALDLADQGQFGQAGNLLRDAARLDPEFALARGMARLMPALDIPPGGERKVMQEMKQAALNEGKKAGEELTNSLDQKDQSFEKKAGGGQGEDKTKKKLGLLEQGEEEGDGEGKTDTQKELDQLGLSDEGDSGSEGGDAPGIGSLADGLGDDGLGTIGGADPGDSDGFLTDFNTDANENANQDNQRQEILASGTVYQGDFFGYVGGDFVDGASTLTESGNVKTLAIQRTGLADEDPSDKLLWGSAYASYIPDFSNPAAYAAVLHSQAGAAVAYGGTPTAPAGLPTSGQTRFATLIVHSTDADPDSAYTFVDWNSGKVFSPVTYLSSSGNDDSSPLMIGSVNRSNAGIDLTAWLKSRDVDFSDQRFLVSDSMHLDFFGATPLLAGGQTEFTKFSATRVAQETKGQAGMLLLDSSLYPALNETPDVRNQPLPPVVGETWQGVGTGVRYNRIGQFFAADEVTSSFTFDPAQGQVVGGLSNPASSIAFSTLASDPNAFIDIRTFGAQKNVNASGVNVPAFYSTQGDYSGSGWDHHYHSIGYWSWDLITAFVDSIYMPYSTWVAGQLTETVDIDNLGGQYAGYLGKVLGSTLVGTLLTGDFMMTVDFGQRRVSGSLYDITQSDGTLWLDQADFLAPSFAGATFLTSILSGPGLQGGKVEGLFYGDAANESGGAWKLVRAGGGNGNEAVGVYTSARGNLYAADASPYRSGTLGGLGASGAWHLSNPIAAQVGPASQGVFAGSNGAGGFSVANVTWQSVAGTNYAQWTLAESDTAFYVPTGAGTVTFPNSYIQRTSDADFHRFLLRDGSGNLIEGYTGDKAASLPNTGITRFDLNQSGAIGNGVAYIGSQNGNLGSFPGQLYVNWQTGQAMGYNAAPGVGPGGGMGLFVGHVDAGALQGSYLARSYRQTVEESTGAYRWMTDASGVALDFFGKNGIVGVGGNFAASWQGESLAQPVTAGHAQITGVANGALAVNSPPAVNEVWNGFAVGYMVERDSGERFNLVNTDAMDLAFTLNRAGGHVHAELELEAGQEDIHLAITSDDNPGANQPSYSVYVSPKAFAAVEESPTTGGAATPNFVAATPEMNGEAEADRYDYTTWGVWGGDYGDQKILTAMPNSQWVAGKLTNTVDMPGSGTATYSGQVMGQVTGSTSGFVQGSLDMNVDFGQRSVGGSMNNLQIIAGTPNNQAGAGAAAGAMWVSQANLSGNWNAGSVQYNAAISGTGVAGGTATGAFFGPQAVETGGRWAITTTTGSQGAGVFVGKRGDISSAGSGL